jgi:hypothetical protein
MTSGGHRPLRSTGFTHLWRLPLRPAIADYQVGRLLDAEDGPQARWLVEPPERLGLPAGATVVAHLVPLPDSVAWNRLLARLSLAAGAGADHLAGLVESARAADGGWITSTHPASNLSRDAGLSRRQHLGAIAGACRGAHQLHEVGMAHGAIRPDTIWVEPVGGDAPPAGVLGPTASWALEDGLAWPGGPAGDLAFVDPSLLLGAPPSRASDLWSLGVVLHRALSGHDLYDDPPGAVGPADVQRHRDEPPRIDPLLRPEMGELLASCLAHDPADRPPSALALAQRIDAVIAEMA